MYVAGARGHRCPRVQDGCHSVFWVLSEPDEESSDFELVSFEGVWGSGIPCCPQGYEYRSYWIGDMNQGCNNQILHLRGWGLGACVPDNQTLPARHGVWGLMNVVLPLRIIRRFRSYELAAVVRWAGLRMLHLFLPRAYSQPRPPCATQSSNPISSEAQSRLRAMKL